MVFGAEGLGSMRSRRAALHEFLQGKGTTEVLSGIDPSLKFEVHSIRPSLRIDWDERPLLQWVIELTQRIQQDEGYYFRGVARWGRETLIL